MKRVETALAVTRFEHRTAMAQKEATIAKLTSSVTSIFQKADIARASALTALLTKQVAELDALVAAMINACGCRFLNSSTMRRSPSASRLLIARIIAQVKSATDSVSTSGVLVTITPRDRAYFTSMLL